MNIYLILKCHFSFAMQYYCKLLACELCGVVIRYPHLDITDYGKVNVFKRIVLYGTTIQI
jgi:hypothetical protein